MNFGFNPDVHDMKDPGRDEGLGEMLKALDPATGDPNYWMRFRSEVVEKAALQLARRRREAQLTIQDVMSSWSRTVMPTALFAAALAGIALIRPGADVIEQPAVAAPLAVELPQEVAPVLLSPEEAAGIVAFASSDEF